MKQKVGKYSVEMEGDRLYIGDSPQLVVNLKTQKNFIRCKNENIPYKRNSSKSGFTRRETPGGFKTAVDIIISRRVKLQMEYRLPGHMEERLIAQFLLKIYLREKYNK